MAPPLHTTSYYSKTLKLNPLKSQIIFDLYKLFQFVLIGIKLWGKKKRKKRDL